MGENGKSSTYRNDLCRLKGYCGFGIQKYNYNTEDRLVGTGIGSSYSAQSNSDYFFTSNPQSLIDWLEGSNTDFQSSDYARARNKDVTKTRPPNGSPETDNYTHVPFAYNIPMGATVGNPFVGVEPSTIKQTNEIVYMRPQSPEQSQQNKIIDTSFLNSPYIYYASPGNQDNYSISNAALSWHPGSRYQDTQRPDLAHRRPGHRRRRPRQLRRRLQSSQVSSRSRSVEEKDLAVEVGLVEEKDLAVEVGLVESRSRSRSRGRKGSRSRSRSRRRKGSRSRSRSRGLRLRRRSRGRRFY